MSSKISDKVMPMRGRLEFRFRNKETGEILDEFGDNLVVNVGMSQIIRAFTTASPAGGSLQYVLQTFKIGDDIGTGTLLVPEPAKPSDTNLSQNVVYTAPYGDINITYPNYYSVELRISLDGNTVMAAYPAEVDLRFSSAGLYSGDDQIFAYRRFQTRTITREIVIDVKWTLYFDGQGGV